MSAERPVALPLEPARELTVDGRWFRDTRGRYVLLRGVNFGARAKLPPYLPVLPGDLESATAELDLLPALGMNVARVLVIWKALAPRPTAELTDEGRAYLEQLRAVVRALWARGLYVILDVHQDIAHESFGGDGFPDWARAEVPQKAPASTADWGSFYYDALFNGDRSGPVRRTLRALWDNRLTTAQGLRDYPVQDALVRAIGWLAAAFCDEPGVLGYEPFNEPHQVGLPRRHFEAEVLPRYYHAAWKAVRAHDAKAFLFVEPRVDWTVFDIEGDEFQWASFTRTPTTALEVRAHADGRIQYGSAGMGDRTIFAFHHYDPWTLLYSRMGAPDSMDNKARQWPALWRDHLVAAAVERGLVPFATELGAMQTWKRFETDLRPEIYWRDQARAYMDLQMQQVEANHVCCTYWNYDLYNSATHGDGWNEEDFSLLGPSRVPRNCDIVARPYPMRSAARPTLVAFDLESRHFSLRLKGVPVDAPTVIHVPLLHFADGNFQIRATSPSLSWDARAQLLSWAPTASAEDHLLVIAPPEHFDAALLPEAARELLPQARYAAMAVAL